MKDFTVYNGLFCAISSQEKCVVLRYASISVRPPRPISCFQSSATPVDQLTKDITLIIPQKDIVSIRAKKVRFLLSANTSSFLENRLRLGLGPFDPSRRLSRNGPFGAVVPFSPSDS